MKQTKIITDDEYVFIECPHCDNACQHGIDDARKRFQSFDVLDWEEGKNEVSIMRCQVCNEKFRLEWDYNNRMYVETGRTDGDKYYQTAEAIARIKELIAEYSDTLDINDYPTDDDILECGFRLFDIYEQQ